METEKYSEYRRLSGDYYTVKLAEKWGIINEKGEEVIPCKYDEVSLWSDSVVRVGLDGKYGFVALDGKEIMPCKYSGVENSGWVRTDSLLVISMEGVVVSTLNYEELCPLSDNLSKVRIKSKWGIINKDGEEVVPCRYDAVES